MSQPTLFQSVSLTVSDLTHYLRQILESDMLLQDIWVQGEVSNLSRPTSGHLYFTLKDNDASLRCVIWRSNAIKLRLALQNGAAVEAHGAVSLYERDGIYQLYIDAMRMAGEGRLYQEFLRLKARLEAEGLFDEARKRQLPERPRQIGIVTSPTGAALQDMLNTLRARYPLVEVTVAPAAVQGDTAPLEIVAALRALNRLIHPDIIIIGRGGGSLEDLWAFNDERVVRAIVASETPVISGVGHETDFTLADFAADVRAPTPTGAAVLATPHINDIWANLSEVSGHLKNLAQTYVDDMHQELEDMRLNLERSSPLWQIQNGRQRLDELAERNKRAVFQYFRFQRTRWEGQNQRLQSLNPLSVLKRGFAVLTQEDGKVIRSTRQVHTGEKVKAQIADGQILTRVEKVTPE